MITARWGICKIYQQNFINDTKSVFGRLCYRWKILSFSLLVTRITVAQYCIKEAIDYDNMVRPLVMQYYFWSSKVQSMSQEPVSQSKPIYIDSEKWLYVNS